MSADSSDVQLENLKTLLREASAALPAMLRASAPPPCELCALRHRGEQTCLEHALYLLALEHDRPPNPGRQVSS